MAAARNAGGGRASVRKVRRGPTWSDVLWKTARIFLVAYLVVLLLLMWYEESMIFPAPKYPAGNWQPVGLDLEEAWLQAADGTRLYGWYFPHERPRHYLIYFHGNGEHIAYNADLALLLRERLEASVFLFDYRGYGRSEGKPNEPGIMADGRAALAWLTEREKISSSQVVLMGRSLGGAVAVDLAAEFPVKALVLENTLTSMPDVAAQHFPLIPVRLLMRTRLNSLAKIGNYHGPVFQSHGTDDEVVPYRLGQKLHAAIPGRKILFSIPGGTHNEGPPSHYYDSLARFLNEES